MADTGRSQKLTGAPAPDDDRKPDTPAKVTKSSWKYVFKRTLSEFSTDQCTDIAASLTYYAVLSLFPMLIALVSLLGVFGQGRQSADTLLSILASVAPRDALDVISGPIEQFSTAPSAGFALVAGIAVALWSASGYVGAFSRAMNRIYAIDEGRSFLTLKPTQLLVTVISIALLLVAVLIVAISGPITDAVGAALGLGQTVQLVWSIAKWPVLAATVVLLIAVLYYFTPNVRQPKFRWLSLGALVALVAIVVASLGFGFYVATFSNYAKTYGSLAGIIIFLLWLWLTNLALLFGAEFDAELERGRQLQAGITAEQNIQLPPRGTRKSQKAALKEMQTVADGRRIRKANAGPRP
ncbi:MULTISPECIES: YihY/virulence factor BrkB family protein [Cryobacterium]|jgi:membrane protein|uniref:YihY/virulence factor BrkB family protein n=1 Tax=Cryobacterium lyxosi TaxID=1259228 RepID=A0A4R8Z8R7_9MICO|nr:MULTISPECIES: YihY/virulence factor BrkB family protein [Cryobacterium]TFD22815.1 YihY/virulence factor BrkB family protein [Cryobacterium lyxosi]